jgi:putative acyl-CoA dehydrogenase
VLRVFGKSTATREAAMQELEQARGRHRHFDAAFERFAAAVGSPALPEAQARGFAQAFVTLMQASLLLSAAASPAARAVAEGFCATRLDSNSGWGAVFGAGGAVFDVKAVLDRAWSEP